ncbi:hypothetical protein JNW88_00315 [Micromonospora sp. ATA32]|nr:hypothetical protein [Micromonospora sp. ATA32]
MTDKPYTDADVKLVARALVDAEDTPRWVPDDADPDEAERGHYAHAVLAALAVAGRLATNGRCGDIAPSLSLLASRIRQTCRLTAGHAGWHRGDDGSEWVEHGPADAARQQHHVIAFTGDGTWSLEHPPSCAAVGRCRVAVLAHLDVTASVARPLAGGRYACAANDLDDLFQLGDRLHDDQCTPPVCAACCTDSDVAHLTATVRVLIGWPISAGEAATIVTAVLQELAEMGRLTAAEPVNDIEATGRCCCAGCVGMGPCDRDLGSARD